MDGIVEWAMSVKEDSRKKPNKDLQKQLWNLIVQALHTGTTIDECIKAACCFNALVLEPFYREYYWNFDESERKEWDQAFIKWADSKKPVESSTIRIAHIIRYKLMCAKSVEAVISELKWLSVHENKKSASEYKKLRENSLESNLRCLLSLDMSEWAAGQSEIYKLFGILFSESADPETKKQYEEFKKRNQEFIPIAPTSENFSQKSPAHGNVKAKATKNTKQKDVEAAESKSKSDQECFPQPKGQSQLSEKAQSKNKKVQSKREADQEKNVSDAPEEKQKSQDQAEPERKESVKKLLEPVKELTEKEEIELESAASAELIKQIEEQKAKIIEQEVKIKELFGTTNAQKVQLESQAGRIDMLKKNCNAAELLAKELSDKLSEERGKTQLLQAENEKDKSIIAQLHQMTDNSIRQELDGFKEKLRQAMASIVKDFHEEYEENEKAEVYGALLEDLIYILRTNDLLVEEK